MRSTSRLPKEPRKSRFDVPLAGWILSAITFLIGTVLTPIVQRLTFDGVSVSQSSDFSVKSDVNGVFEQKTMVKIVNTTDKPISLESVSVDLSRATNAELVTIGTTAFIVTGSGIDTPKPNKHGRNEDLPLLLAAKSSESVVIWTAFRRRDVLGRLESTDDIRKAGETFSELQASRFSEGLPVQLTINGKLRSLRLYPKSREHVLE
jgi:hypothetical protein